LLISIAGRLGIYVIWFFALGAVPDFVWSEPLALIAALLLVPLAVLVWASKERLQCLALVTLLTLFWIALVTLPLMIFVGVGDPEDMTTVWAAILFSLMLVPIGVIAIDVIAPVKSLNQRLLFLAMGTLSLVALNFISVFALQHLIEAPKPPL
jgi:hypothetical protein